MVLSALGLLLGGRADATLVRPGADRLTVEGRWRLPGGHRALLRAAEAGGEADEDGTLLVRRTVAPDGRSRTHLGGAGVPVGVLVEVGEDLVAVHGQADQRLLVRPGAQRDLVDRYGGAALAALLERYQAAFGRRRAAAAELAELTGQARERAVEADGLRHGLDRIEALDPQPGEEQGLAALISRLAHADALAAAAAAAQAGLLGDERDPLAAGAQQLAAQAARTLRGAADHDPELANLAERLDEVSALLAELTTDLGGYGTSLGTEPEALAEAQERQAALTALTRRYSPQDPTGAGLLAWAGDAAARLAALEGDDGRRAGLTAELVGLDQELSTRAGELTAARRTAAERLAAAATSELAGLAMAGAALIARIQPQTPGLHGADDVTLLLAAHEGAALRPLGRGASGGELSRLMLALEVVLAGADPVPTLVFDEVDAGVGGQAAAEVGARLARLARHHQVLVVTHLPQVAAWADLHVRVRKEGDRGVTVSDVQQLDPAERIEELARMLAGMADSSAAQEHADELLTRAAAAKSQQAQP
jgi:DNA repair protein RecN (Recombination protein N)